MTQDKTDISEIVMDVEDIIGVSQEDWKEAEELVEEYIEMIQEFNEKTDEKLEEINQLPVYEELGVELHVDIEHEFSMEEREE